MLKSFQIIGLYLSYRNFQFFLEKVFHKRLMSFLDKKNILYKSQYGFRKKYVYIIG